MSASQSGGACTAPSQSKGSINMKKLCCPASRWLPASRSAAPPRPRSSSASPARSPARTPPSALSSRTAPSRPSPTSTPPAASSARRSTLEVGDDVSDPEAGRLGRQQVRRRRRHVRRRPLQLGRHHPGLGSLCRERHAMITPSATNPQFTERGLWNVFRTCGRDDQQGSCGPTILAELQGQEDRHRPRQDDLWPGPCRRDQEAS